MEPRKPKPKPKPKPNAKRTSVVVGTTPAGEDHQVVSVLTKGADRITHMRKPCADCSWRRDAVGVFPAEAFRHSARTAYDPVLAPCRD